MNEKEFKEIYSEFWENMEQAPDEVIPYVLFLPSLLLP